MFFWFATKNLKKERHGSVYYYVLFKEENGFGKQIQGAYIGDVINHSHPQLTKPWQNKEECKHLGQLSISSEVF